MWSPNDIRVSANKSSASGWALRAMACDLEKDSGIGSGGQEFNPSSARGASSVPRGPFGSRGEGTNH